MSSHPSSPPPPYEHRPSTLHTSGSHGREHARSTPSPQTNTHPTYVRGFKPPRHLHKHVCHHSVHVTVPATPAPRTVSHYVNYRAINSLPATRVREDNGLGCCCFVILAAVLTIVVFVSLLSPSEMIAWTHLESRSCTTYATREYEAERSISFFEGDWMKTCNATPITVHGQLHWPFRCELRSGKVIGHFAINHVEPDCVTYWSSFKDMGCTAKGSKKRQMEQRLENLPWGSEYKEFCATTPTRFLDMDFAGADSCVHSIWGVYGKWFIDDDSC